MLSVFKPDYGKGMTYSAAEENPKGFFENERIVNFNDRLLALLGGGWDNPFFHYSKAVETVDLIPLLNKAAVLIADEFGSSNLWVVKDPRFSLVMPFWQQVFKLVGCSNVYTIHCVRNPLEVAYSQRARHLKNPVFHRLGKQLQQTVFLWMINHYQLLESIVDNRNIILSFDRLIQNPNVQIQRIGALIGEEPDPRIQERYISQFIDRSLKKQNTTVAELTVVMSMYPELLTLYRSLSEFADKPCVGPVETNNILRELQTIEIILNYTSPMASLYTASHIAFLQTLRTAHNLNTELKRVREERDNLLAQKAAI